MRAFSRWRAQRRCFHHSQLTGETWVTGTLIDLGRRKMWTCRECDRRWFW